MIYSSYICIVKLINNMKKIVETKKEKIIRMLKTDDSYDIIALHCNCEVSEVKKIERNIKLK